jgi:hypothetical protein
LFERPAVLLGIILRLFGLGFRFPFNPSRRTEQYLLAGTIFDDLNRHDFDVEQPASRKKYNA